ncbi:HAD family hydrolase [Pedococcus sp. 5OH_020]|uniref:HAD family hydrolase n=1 Tax=Pedococcus sp. 5OH_020 TaxID=2989814 RepID=UPI0022E9C1B7|nr:HAD family hydrolase [Pedococcus sp. 5OH_020]
MDLVIFDCDGVLVDSEPIAARVGAAVLTGMGWQISAEEVVQRFLGCTEEYFHAEVERQLGRRLPRGWDDEFQHLYDAAYAAELTPVEGIVPLLEELARRGIPTCVASNGSHDKMRRTLGATGLHDRFNGRIFSAQDVAFGKPEPDLYLHAARTMGVAPGRCVVVEDSPRGVAAARAAAMACIGYAALTPPQRLAGPGVSVCTTMTQVRDELRGLRASHE